jgi:polysaccharide pyruvyl transferase WcaK-like protein
VWGHFAGGNLGDELVVATILEAIRRRRPAQSVVAVSSRPADTERRHGVRTLPLNPGVARTGAPSSAAGAATTAHRGLAGLARRVPGARRAVVSARTLVRAIRELPYAARSYRRLKDIDTVVVAGSGQLLDKWQGPWWHPYTTFRWALLARLAGTKMVYPSVGAGPIDHPLSRLMFRKSLEWASFVSVRDEHSAEVLRAIGVIRELPVCPDMGWAHDVAADLGGWEPPDPTVVGVNPMSHEDPRYWPRGDARRYAAYLAKLVDFVVYLLQAGHHVLLFSSQPKADGRVVADLVPLLKRRGLGEHPLLESAVDEIADVDDLVRTIARCSYVVAGRFHSVLLPVALGIPTIGLAYHAKTCEILRQVGRSERCLDIDRFEVTDLVHVFERLQDEDGHDERRALWQASGQLRSAVETQFDSLFGRDETRQRR